MQEPAYTDHIAEMTLQALAMVDPAQSHSVFPGLSVRFLPIFGNQRWLDHQRDSMQPAKAFPRVGGLLHIKAALEAFSRCTLRGGTW